MENMNDKMQFIALAIQKYNPKNAKSCEIVEFIQYPQKRKNGAEYALVFSVHRWNGDSSNTIEYNSYAQLKAWFDFHC